MQHTLRSAAGPRALSAKPHHLRSTLGGRTLTWTAPASAAPAPRPLARPPASTSSASPPPSMTSTSYPGAPAALTGLAASLGGGGAGGVVAAAAATATAAPTAAPPTTTNNVASLAYELVQGNIVRFLPESQQRAAPTAVLVHGILGNRRNLASFAHMLVEAFPSWQVLLVDLRCHGESAHSSGGGTPREGPHSVATAARDVLALLRAQKLFPQMLIGHSFGGKVVLSMAQQFADACNPNNSTSSMSSMSSMSSVDQATIPTQTTTSLPRPVQVWVLDTLPGEVRQGDVSGSQGSQRPTTGAAAAAAAAAAPHANEEDDLDALLRGSDRGPESAEAQALLQQQRRDHPADLIQALRLVPTPVPSRNDVLEHLTRAGFSAPVARWMTTNLRPAVPGGSAARDLAWTFDVDGLADMYRSYEAADLWPLLESPPQGLRVDFVRAEGSTFRWAGPDRERLEQLGHRVHVLVRSGHWVHTDNPQGLIELMAQTFHAQVDLRLRRSPPPSPQPQ